MESTTLQAPETINEQLKLIEGTFNKKEALGIINNVLDVKINFHKLQRLSRTEGNMNDKCTYDNSRITELIRDKAAIKEFLLSLDTNGSNIKIESTINISLDK